MLPQPIEHEFIIDGERYKLVEWTRGGERRIRAEFAMAIAAAPVVIDNIDGQDLYAEAVARECLREAPALFWEELPPQANSNGTPRRTVTFEHVPRVLWGKFRGGIDAFLGKLFPPAATNDAPVTEPGAAESALVAAPETVPPRARVRAE